MKSFKNHLEEDLRQWFKQKWVRMDTKGNIKGDCARDPGEGKPKCLPQSKAHSIGKEGRASAAQRKRREDPNPDRRGAPINVKTESIEENHIAIAMGKMLDDETGMVRNQLEQIARFCKLMNDTLDTLGTGKDTTQLPAWVQAKITLATDYLDTVANYMAGKEEEITEACWDGYTAKGLKKKGSRMVPNCVPEEIVSEKGRCWPGHKPVPGKTPFSPGSCVKESDKEKTEQTNESNFAAIAAATAIAKKKSGNYDSKGFRKTAYKNPDAPNVKSNAERKKELDEDGVMGGSVGPTNVVGSGAIAGTGGAGGEPGVSKKRKPILFSMVKRKTS